MELLEGGDLGDLKRLIRRTMFSEAALVALLTDCIRALCYLNQNMQLAHFDIKPQNILLEVGQRRAKLADFGLACNPELTVIKYPRGTYRYMPPELYSEIRADYRVDVWSLGITFYEVASGEHPFQLDENQLLGADEKILLRSKILASSKIAPLTSRYFQVSSDFANLIARMLEPRQSERPHSAEIRDAPLIQTVILSGKY